MSEISFSSKAYCKLMLHAAKYPHCSVNGLLLAKANSGKSNKEVEFVDAVPLFHIAINLIPMAEVALTQVEQKAAKEGLVIAGYYVGHENFKENSIEKAFHRISDKIADYFPNACVVVVDNPNLTLCNMDNLSIRVAQYIDGKYKAIDIQRVYLKPDNALDICTALVNNRAYDELYDFDNHLDDVSIDYMNSNLNEKIESFY